MIKSNFVFIFLSLFLLVHLIESMNKNHCNCGNWPRLKSNQIKSRVRAGIKPVYGKFSFAYHIILLAGINIRVDNLTASNIIEPYCGGSLISRKFVLTSAHCCKGGIKNEGIDEFFYATANIDLGHIRKEASHVREVDYFITHPKYNAPNSLHDIGLVVLKEPFETDTDPQLDFVCLLGKPINLKYRKLIFTGNGQVNKEDLPVKNIKRYPLESANKKGNSRAAHPSVEKFNLNSYTNNALMAYFEVTNNERCQEHVQKYKTNHFCATSEVSSICDADFGGPLMFAFDRHLYQVGVASYVDYTEAGDKILEICRENSTNFFEPVFLKENIEFIKKETAGDACFAEIQVEVN